MKRMHFAKVWILFAVVLSLPSMASPNIEGYGIFDSHYLNGAIFDENELDRFIFKVRRIKLSINDDINDQMKYKLGFKIDPEDSEFEWSDAFIQYRFDKKLNINIGRFKIPVGLENNQSTKALALQERSLASEMFTPGRRLGIALYWQPKFAALTLGSFYFASEDEDYDDGYFNMAKISAHMGQSDQGLLHFGGHTTYQTAIDNNLQLESSIIASGIKDQIASKKYDPQAIVTQGIEVGALYRTLLLQGEWFDQTFDDPEQHFIRWQGGYFQMSFALLGRGRDYDGGEFSPDWKHQPFGEFTVRFSRVRLRDVRESLLAESASAAYTYYPTAQTKLALQYESGHRSTFKAKSAEHLLESGTAWTLRLQFMFD